MGDRRGAGRVLVGNPERKRQLEDLGVDGRIILECIFNTLGGSMNWIDLVQDRDGWRRL